jgi:UDP-N-acetylglucosamine:LPS N-acetylglucosamine transferase
VAQLLALFRKMPIVEHEADEILGYAQTFTSPIRRRVEDAVTRMKDEG